MTVGLGNGADLGGEGEGDPVALGLSEDDLDLVGKVTKLLVLCQLAKMARLFVPDKPYQLNLIFASKVRAYPSGASFM